MDGDDAPLGFEDNARDQRPAVDISGAPAGGNPRPAPRRQLVPHKRRQEEKELPEKHPRGAPAPGAKTGKG